MKAGDLVILNEPQWNKTSGQGQPPKGMSINGVLLPWGHVFKLSSSTTYPGNVEATPYPLMHTRLAEEIENQLTKQNNEEE